MFRRRNYVINLSLVALLAVVGFFGWRILYPAKAAVAARTATASVQDVSTSVSATGSVQAAVDIGLNFGTQGIVRTLNVKAGDKVKKGQLLATVDDRAARLSVLQARSSELSAMSSYKNLQNAVRSASNSVVNAKNSVKTSENSVVSAQNSVTNAEGSVTNAEATLASAQAAIPAAAAAAVITLANSDQAITNAQAALTKLMAGPTAATLASQAQQVQSAQNSVESANIALTNAYASQKQLQDTVALNAVNYDRSVSRASDDFQARCTALGFATSAECALSTNAQSQYRTLQDANQAKVSGLLKDQQSLDNASTSIKTAQRNVISAQTTLDNLLTQNSLANQPPTQADIDAANANIATAQRAKLTAQANISSQSLQLENAVISATTSLANAKTSVVNATVGVENSKVALANTKLTVGTAQAGVESAKVNLANGKVSVEIAKISLSNAQDNLANTKLFAPIKGTVAAVASDVGVNAGTTSAGSGGSPGYIVLTDLTGLQVSASFAEADVVGLKAGQTATITFDSIPNSSATGEVLSIAPLNNASSAGGSVTSYAVTFSMTGAPAAVKPGMTAQVTVVTAESLSVLAVPSAALTQRGDIYTVTMKPTTVGGVGERRTVTVGLKGDTATEIVSGLNEGDEVELRTTTTSSSSNGFPSAAIPGAVGGAAIGGGGGQAVRVGG